MFNDEDEDWMMDDGSSFEETYQCFPASDLLLKSLREAVEFGGKVVLPASALETLSRMNVSYPLMFSVENEANGKTTHCGVLEFSAPEGTIYLPLWAMKTLGVSSGDFVTLQSVSLRLGTLVKLQPQSTVFLDITDPRAVLEHSLRAFSALTRGDIIQIYYNDQVYELLIMEVKPEGPKQAISIVETDLQVDFAPPLGYVEPTYERPKEKSIAGSLGHLSAEGSVAGSPATASTLSSSFKPFSGQANKLKTTGTASSNPALQEEANSSPAPLRLPAGMLYFGNTKPVEPKDKQEDSTGFKAFKGSSNKLR